MSPRISCRVVTGLHKKPRVKRKLNDSYLMAFLKKSTPTYKGITTLYKDLYHFKNKKRCVKVEYQDMCAVV